MKYTIRVRNEAAEAFTVSASDYEEAAQKAAKRINCGKVGAWRVTGDPGKPGVYQGFREFEGGLTSAGPQFSVC